MDNNGFNLDFGFDSTDDSANESSSSFEKSTQINNNVPNNIGANNIIDNVAVSNISNNVEVSDISNNVETNDISNNVETSSTFNSENINVESVQNMDLNEADIDFSYFDGKVLELLGYHFLSFFITSLTFGVFWPWAECIFLRYKYSHIIYNGKRLKFDGDPEKLFILYFKWIFFVIITFGIYLLWVPVRKKEWEIAQVHFEDEPLVDGDSFFTGSVLGLFGTNLLCAFITVISLGLFFPFAFCKRTKWFLNNSVISKQYVYFDGRAIKLFFKLLLWGFLTIITFGIYGWFVELNLTKWIVENTTLIKDDALSS